MRLFLDILNCNTKQSEENLKKINDYLVCYLNRAMRTLRRRILAMATNIIAKTKAIFEYESLPTTNK